MAIRSEPLVSDRHLLPNKYDFLAAIWLVTGTLLILMIPPLREIPLLGSGWLWLVAMPVISLLTASRLRSAAVWRAPLVRASHRRHRHRSRAQAKRVSQR